MTYVIMSLDHTIRLVNYRPKYEILPDGVRIFECKSYMTIADLEECVYHNFDKSELRHSVGKLFNKI